MGSDRLQALNDYARRVLPPLRPAPSLGLEYHIQKDICVVKGSQRSVQARLREEAAECDPAAVMGATGLAEVRSYLVAAPLCAIRGRESCYGLVPRPPRMAHGGDRLRLVALSHLAMDSQAELASDA